MAPKPMPCSSNGGPQHQPLLRGGSVKGHPGHQMYIKAPGMITGDPWGIPGRSLGGPHQGNPLVDTPGAPRNPSGDPPREGPPGDPLISWTIPWGIPLGVPMESSQGGSPGGSPGGPQGGCTRRPPGDPLGASPPRRDLLGYPPWDSLGHLPGYLLRVSWVSPGD